METRRKVRLSIDCSPEERRSIKILAAKEDKTISEYLIDLAKDKMGSHSHEPVSILKSKESHQPAILDDYWRALGYN